MARRFVLALAIVLTLLAPSVVKAQTAADEIAADVDAWWNAQFAARGLPYSSPRLELISEPGTEFCDFIDLFYAPATVRRTRRSPSQRVSSRLIMSPRCCRSLAMSGVTTSRT